MVQKLLTWDEVKELAAEKKLRRMEITHGMNGYPKDTGDHAIYGFETFEEAEAFAKEIGGAEVKQFFYKNGWHLCEDRGTAFGAFLAAELVEGMGESYALCTKQYLQEEIDSYCHGRDIDEPVEKFLEFAERIKQLHQHVDDCDDDEIVITCDGNYYDTIKQQPMEFSHDSKNCFIGVLWERIELEAEEEEEE